MRFLSLYRPRQDKENCAPPSPEDIARMGQLIEEEMKSGVLLATEGCQPSAKGARVRIDGGEFSVTDGPFTEAKELIAGFALLQVGSKEEAIEAAKRFLRVVGEGEAELRQMYDPADFAPGGAP
jgi:hypothetical protein